MLAKPSIQRVNAALYLGVKRPWREVKHSPMCRAEVKNAWNIAHAFVMCAWINLPLTFLCENTTLGDTARMRILCGLF